MEKEWKCDKKNTHENRWTLLGLTALNGNLGNPRGIRPDNECIVGIQKNISLDTILGEETIGQHFKKNGKQKGISHLTRMPIIADTTPVPQIHSGVKLKVNSSHINRCNPSRICPNNEIIIGIQENISDHDQVEESIGKYVKTNGKPKGTRHLTRMPIVDSHPIQKIHPEVKCQVDTTHIDTDNKLFLSMQKSYPSPRDDYGIMNHDKKWQYQSY